MALLVGWRWALAAPHCGCRMRKSRGAAPAGPFDDEG